MLATPEAHVIHNGHHVTVPARQLVPGDVSTPETGNYLATDVRRVSCVNLWIEEASLMGERRRQTR